MKPAIEVTHLTKRYGPVTALDDVTVSIEQDSITGILGRNGARKTVLMSVITAQEAPSAGTIRVFGQSPWENASFLSRTCFIRDNQRYPDDYKLAHALRVGPLFYENWDSDLATRIVETFEIPGGRPIRKLSRGQISAVGLLLGLASRAPITFFDEPYLGLDVTARTLVIRSPPGGLRQPSAHCGDLHPSDRRDGAAAGADRDPAPRTGP